MKALQRQEQLTPPNAQLHAEEPYRPRNSLQTALWWCRKERHPRDRSNFLPRMAAGLAAVAHRLRIYTLRCSVRWKACVELMAKLTMSMVTGSARLRFAYAYANTMLLTHVSPAMARAVWPYPLLIRPRRGTALIYGERRTRKMRSGVGSRSTCVPQSCGFGSPAGGCCEGFHC
jgi:hypothetical protein